MAVDVELHAQISKLLAEFGLLDFLEAEETQSLIEGLEDVVLSTRAAGEIQGKQRSDTERLDKLEGLLLANGNGASGFIVQLRPDCEQQSGLLLGWGRKRSLRRAIDAALD